MKINLNEVVPGTVLEKPIVKNNVTLVEKGEVLTPILINRLIKRFGINEIEVSDENNLVDDFSNTINEHLFNNCKEALIKNDIVKIEESANEMVTAILNNVDLEGGFSNLKYDLTAYATKDHTTLDSSLNHSIRVATFSIVLTYLYNEKIKELVRNKDEQNKRTINYKNIAIAALMHDSGKHHQDESLLEEVRKIVGIKELHNTLLKLKDVPLDRFDNQFIEFYSYCLANKFKNLPQNVKTMILYSNENDNNTGPLQSQTFIREKTHRDMVGARIIHLCSLYDEYLLHCINTNEELENIIAIIGQAASNGVISAELASLFLQNIPLYPIGTKVELSNGEQAVVVKTFTGYTASTRPVVRLLSTREIIRLEEATSITIIGINKEKNLIEELVDSQLKEVDHTVLKHRR